MNDEEKRIEWDVPQPTLKEWLLVSRCVDGEPSLREHVDATIEDLRKACEAVGLVVVDRSVFDGLNEGLLEQRNLAMVRYEQAEGLAASRLDHIELLTAEAATLRAQLAELRAEHKAMVAASLRELEVLRAQLAAAEALLEATRQASQCAPKSADIPKMVADIVANRKAVCEHARALEAQLAVLTSSEGRATDEDLVEIWANAFDKEQSLATHVPGSGTARLAAARTVAARVRRERGQGLVERLVAADDVGEFAVVKEAIGSAGAIRVTVRTRDPKRPSLGTYTTNATDVPATDVPATLARLAGLDGGR